MAASGNAFYTHDDLKNYYKKLRKYAQDYPNASLYKNAADKLLEIVRIISQGDEISESDKSWFKTRKKTIDKIFELDEHPITLDIINGASHLTSICDENTYKTLRDSVDIKTRDLIADEVRLEAKRIEAEQKKETVEQRIDPDYKSIYTSPISKPAKQTKIPFKQQEETLLERLNTANNDTELNNSFTEILIFADAYSTASLLKSAANGLFNKGLTTFDVVDQIKYFKFAIEACNKFNEMTKFFDENIFSILIQSNIKLASIMGNANPPSALKYLDAALEIIKQVGFLDAPSQQVKDLFNAYYQIAKLYLNLTPTLKDLFEDLAPEVDNGNLYAEIVLIKTLTQFAERAIYLADMINLKDEELYNDYFLMLMYQASSAIYTTNQDEAIRLLEMAESHARKHQMPDEEQAVLAELIELYNTKKETLDNELDWLNLSQRQISVYERLHLTDVEMLTELKTMFIERAYEFSQLKNNPILTLRFIKNAIAMYEKLPEKTERLQNIYELCNQKKQELTAQPNVGEKRRNFFKEKDDEKKESKRSKEEQATEKHESSKQQGK